MLRHVRTEEVGDIRNNNGPRLINSRFVSGFNLLNQPGATIEVVS